VKVCGFQSDTNESSNKCFHRVPRGSRGGLFIGQLGAELKLSKQPMVAT
jgi:hypothetical protein